MAPEAIHINIWDDYHDDGFVPAGEVQETYAYVEQDLSDETSQEVLALLRAQLEALRQPGSVLECTLKYHDSAAVTPELIGTEHEWCLYKRWQLHMQPLPHRERERLVEQLAGIRLDYKGTPIIVYSES